MKYLITGAAGFVGRHLISTIKAMEPLAEIAATDLVAKPSWMAGISGLDYAKANLLDKGAIGALLERTKPERVIHLASFSSVAYSWDKPAECFYNNTLIFINIIEGVRQHAPSARVLSVGSSEEYGNVLESDVPLRESQPLRPTSPYGVARVSQEMLSQVFVRGYGLDIRITRSFNHVGPFQREIFVIPGLVKQFVEAMANGADEVNLSVGNIDVVRDFTDVRDIVKAYLAIMERGVPGEVYNVCSGLGHAIREIIGEISKITGMKYAITMDESKVRPLENMIIIGDNHKILKSCDWKPAIGIEKTLADTVRYWQRMMNQEQGKSF
jgi:GDP-4-dehydro-6-deoxy-D-mannose reductase